MHQQQPLGNIALAQQGVELCRREKWERGMGALMTVADRKQDHDILPGLYYSYLGYCLARFEKRLDEGLELCRHGVKIQLHEVENLYNLARTCMLAGDRQGAVKALEEGLFLNPDFGPLIHLRKEMGLRRDPVLRILSRSNPLNQILGRIRSSWAKQRLSREIKK
ncbi:MAG: hypothetical protein K0U98_18195 [Deltaproteobacteria bacterium]|nr:hypothetical protein [Deltaproteobacteria bacterium]